MRINGGKAPSSGLNGRASQPRKPQTYLRSGRTAAAFGDDEGQLSGRHGAKEVKRVFVGETRPDIRAHCASRRCPHAE